MISRRKFLTTSAAGLGAALAGGNLISAPLILAPSRTTLNTERGTLIFRPHLVQSGSGPHLGRVKSMATLGDADWDFPSWAFASDEEWDTFHSNIFVTDRGVEISDAEGHQKFGVNVRWNVEGFGYIYMTADNGGEFYQLPAAGQTREFNLNFELAKSRLWRNRSRVEKFAKDGFTPERDTRAFLDLSDEYFTDAEKASDEEKRGALSQRALYYAMWAAEKLELGKAWFDIKRDGDRPNFFMGCDTKGYPRMDRELFLDLFTRAFNYATITHYLPRFEKEEGLYDYAMRDEQVRLLRERKVTVEGRPVFWADDCCSPDWLKNKTYDQLLKYVEKHTREVVGHYGGKIYAWEIINEAHDPGNALGLKPDQMVEIARLGCEVAKDTNPKVHRLINNCCVQADYVQLRVWKPDEKRFPIITPHQFIKMCHEAGVDFTITGQQLYYPYTNRDLADIIRMTERFEKFGRPVQITEIGATSGPTTETINSGELGLPTHPPDWHRHWDADLQAQWLEEIYTILFSKPWIEAINWYDFVDPYSFLKNGGLLSSPTGEAKPAYQRLLGLREKWRAATKS
ncbi:MAG TPA: endo-1,4-beta-xylanase [bacterium]